MRRARTNCTNPRCREDLRPADAVAQMLGLCPSCRLALLMGFNAGGAITVAVAIIGAILGWFAR